MLGIVVLHYGKEAEPLTRACLRALEKNTTEEFKVVLYVNGGPLPEAFLPPGFFALHAPRQDSLAAAYNHAVTFLKDVDKIAFVHNDCIVPEGWNEPMSAIVEKGDVAFPHVENDPRSPVPRCPEDWPPSCCWMLSEELWDEVGGLDEQFKFCHFEDWDIWMRAIKAGAWLRRADTTVFHARGFTRALEADKANAALIANRRLYEIKHGKEGPCVI